MELERFETSGGGVQKRQERQCRRVDRLADGGAAVKVLVACEESQEVCKAFRALGHEAYSCDIQTPSGGHPEWHILGDALKAVEGGK